MKLCLHKIASYNNNNSQVTLTSEHFGVEQATLPLVCIGCLPLLL